MQNKLSPGKLLDAQGRLCEAGWHTELVREYRRGDIRGGKLRIKEWDYYLIENGEDILCLTLDDNSYMGMISVSLLKRSTCEQITKSIIIPLTMGKVGFPATSVRGDVSMKSGKTHMYFKNDGKCRVLECHYENFDNGAPLDARIVLSDTPRDSMVIATPFPEKPTAFYYNQKIVGMTASGEVTCGGKKITFSPADSQGLLDWGRGVWTYDNTWYWSAAMGTVDEHRFGFNLGYGFGDVSAASENMLFVDGICHKLSRVTFGIPQTADGKDDFLRPWKFTSDDGKFEADFVPQLDRASLTDLKALVSDQHQIFGLFTGKCILDDGTPLHFKNLCGFAEKVHNKW